MLRLLLYFGLGLALPAHASSRVYWIEYLENVVHQAPDYTVEVRSLASACGLSESRFYDKNLPVAPVRQAADAWWVGVLQGLANDPPIDTRCEWDVLFAMLPRPWNAGYVQFLREAIWGDQARPAILRLAQARMLKALPVRLTPEENSRAVDFDRELANVLLGETLDPSVTHRTDIAGLLDGARAVETGSMRLLPRATHFECAGVLSRPFLSRKDEMKNFDSLVLSLRR